MPQVVRTDTHTGITAEHERKLRRHAVPTGFDPNADPIIIGLNAADYTGDVGEIVIGNGASTGDPAFTAGGGNTAIGWNAIAGGLSDDDDANTAVGNVADARGGGACAFGGNSWANDVHAVAVGIHSRAMAPASVAVGHECSANGLHGIAIGDSSEAAAEDYTIAIGSSALGGGANSIAIGRGTDTGGVFDIAIGDGANTGIWGHGTAIGAGAATDDSHQIMLGTVAERVTLPGGFEVRALPTSDPGVSGYVWNDGGILTVSP